MLEKEAACKFVIIGKKRLLTLCGSSSAGIGLLMLTLSLSTNNWITTYERLTRPNTTTVVAVNSGLWRKCWRSRDIIGINKATLWSEQMKEFPDEIERNCSFISYFKDKIKNTGEQIGPEGVINEIRTAAIFPLIGFVTLLIGCSISGLSYCDQKLKKWIFIASGFYVLSGVFLLIGIVLYVGSISQAFDIKNKDTDSEHQYNYDYGLSFYLSVISFIMTEFSGVFCIYLYMAKLKHQGKEMLDFEQHKKPKSPDAIVSCLKFNRHRPWAVIDDRSEVSPTSQMSHQSYSFNRRYSDQMLLRLQNAEVSSIHYHPQFVYSSPQHNTFSRQNLVNNLFIAEYRADKPSPLLPMVNRDLSNNNVSNSPHVVFFDDDDDPITCGQEGPMVTSLILNRCTYFDSPIIDRPDDKQPITTVIGNNVCHRSNNDFKPTNQINDNHYETHSSMSVTRDHYVNFSPTRSKLRKITAV